MTFTVLFIYEQILLFIFFQNGDTALHISAALKRRKIAKLVVEAGIDVNIINKQDETAIEVARRKDHPEVIMTITSLLKVKSIYLIKLEY